jgi:hypothetical protein
MTICKNADCKKQAYYNFADKKPSFCNSHKLEGMIDVKNPKCIKCKLIRPHFNYPDEKKAIYYGDCKKPDMIDVKSTKCITNLCEQFSQKR